MLRHLIIFLLLGIAILGILNGLHEHGVEGGVNDFFKFLTVGMTLLAAYFVTLVALIILSQSLMKRSPRWADRLARLQGLLSPGQNYRVTLLAIHKDNPEAADRLWNEIEPFLASLNSSEAMSLAANYSASLSGRGHYRRARDLLKAYEPKEIRRAYRHHYALYWLNLGWFQRQLGDQEAAEYCLRRALLEHISHPQIRQRVQGLQAVLAYDAGDRETARATLRQSSDKRAFSAWLLAELGESQEAAQRLPDLNTLSEAGDRLYYHLARALLDHDPKQLQLASDTGFSAGQVACFALQHFQDPSYLPVAQQRDPESIWTQRAQQQVPPPGSVESW